MQIEEKNVPYGDLKLEGAGYQNARTVSGLDQKSLFEFACTLAKEGILNRLIVWAAILDGKELNIVIAGQRRYLGAGMVRTKSKEVEAAIKKGHQEFSIKEILPSFDELPCKVVHGTLAEAEAVALAENIHRQELSSYEIAVKLDTLAKRQDQKTLAAHISKSPAYVSTLLSTYKRAVTPLRAAWKSRKLPDELVQDIAKLESEEQTKALEAALEHRSNGHREGKSTARHAVKSKVRPKGKNGRAPGRRYLKVLVKRFTMVDPSDKYVQGALDGLDAAAGGMSLDDILGHNAFKAHEKLVAEAEKKKAEKKAARANKRAGK